MANGLLLRAFNRFASQSGDAIPVACFQGIQPSGAVPMVRVPWNEPGIVGKVLDAGAMGVICPMVNTAEEAARLLSALGQTKRLMVLCRLVDNEMSVGALAESVGLGQSALSQHLARLRDIYREKSAAARSGSGFARRQSPCGRRFSG